MDPVVVLEIIIGLGTAFAGMVATVAWLVKHYLRELVPNGGSSMKDSVDRMEVRIDELYKLMAENH